MAAVVALQADTQGPFAGPLQFRVDGGADGQPAGIEFLLSEDLHELPADFLRKPLRLEELRCAAGAELQRRGDGLLRLDRRYAPVFQHPPHDPVAARERLRPAPDGVVVVGRLGQGGKEGRFGNREIVERAVEIIERRRGDAVGAVAQVNLVQVKLEYGVLGQRLFEPERQDRLPDLPLDGGFRAQQEILCDLLRDRRAAHRPAGGFRQFAANEGVAGPEQAGGIEAGMAVEALVLGGQKRIHDPLGHGIHGHEQPMLDREFRQQAAVAGMHAGGDRRLVGRKPAIGGKAAGEMVGRDERGDSGRRNARGAKPEQPGEDAPQPPHGPRKKNNFMAKSRLTRAARQSNAPAPPRWRRPPLPASRAA